MKEANAEKLQGKTLFITGATGLIGTTIVKKLASMNQEGNLNLKLVLLVRSREKAQTLFGQLSETMSIEFVEGSIENIPEIEGKVDYIIHGANPTSSRYFIDNPVETIQAAVMGTNNVLKIAKDKQVDGFVFLSSMEVYGTPQKGKKVTEKDLGAFDTTGIRNCYPMSKQLCENLCCGYFSEYGVPTKIARLTQTFGPGVSYSDGRVFAEFARCAIEHRNIILKTKGETERDYLYTEDAAEAILTILLSGKNGEAYSVANESTYCSIFEMASMLAAEYGIGVEIIEQDVQAQGYAATLYMDLDTSKLRSLGWEPQVSLLEMYRKMIDYMKENR